MQEVFSKIIEELETKSYEIRLDGAVMDSAKKVIELADIISIVNQIAEECKPGHFGCNSNGQHEKCSSCCDYDCKNRNKEWFGVSDDNNGWIPFVQREMTEDEKESFGDLNFMLDCQLPDEDEEILITYKFKDELYVDVDTFMRDGSECYLDSGRDFVTEAVAWMKKPQPYQPNGE